MTKNKGQIIRFLGWAIASLMLVVAIACTSVVEISPTLSSDSRAAAVPSATISRSLFGMHIENPYKIPWPAVPFASWRLWDVAGSEGTLVFWAHLERFKGQWNFKALDNCVDAAREKGIEIVYTMGITPTWASSRPKDSTPYGEGPSAAPPKNMDDWRNFVRTVATRYKGKIRYYEIWNEPNLKHFYSGTIEEMVALAREAYTIFKQVDPSIQVVSPSVFADYGGVGWLDEYFAKGGTAYTDIVGAHFYIPNDKPPEEMRSLIEQVKQVMAKHKLDKKPLWNTETGFGSKKDKVYYSDSDSMAYVARSYLISWALGVSRFYWYGWNTRNVLTLLMVKEDNSTLTAAAQAYNEIQKWLIGAQMNVYEPDRDGTGISELTRDGKKFWIVWHRNGENNLKVPENWGVRQVRDLTGKQTALPANGRVKIGRSPILLTGG